MHILFHKEGTKTLHSPLGWSYMTMIVIHTSLAIKYQYATCLPNFCYSGTALDPITKGILTGHTWE